ncbi:DNA phosphorothioation-dependent restriction protein DptG [Jeotgalibacillus marinus]|uniref:DNA phosphorothioation-dependent restriction protein DptG n=1 Tax=Jeotgalibacillus marinus TaxID=86667 RepID=A0ABV3Q5M3_9BACL
MNSYFQFDQLEGILLRGAKDNKFSNSTGSVLSVLPFDTKKLPKVFSENTGELLGELMRNNTNMKISKIEEDSFVSNKIVDNILKSIDFNNEEESEEFFEGFLEDYLNMEGSKESPLHPHLFMYNDLSEKERKEKIKYAIFINEVLLGGQDKFKDLFLDKSSDNLLTQLIMESLPELIGNSNQKKNKYAVINVGLVEQFQKDFIYLSNKKEYFLKHLFTLIHYYLFQYFLQFFKSAQSFGTVSDRKVTPLNHVLDWETGVGSYREAVKEYNTIREHADKLFVHVHCMSHLSHNQVNLENERHVFSYYKVKKDLESLDDEMLKREKENLISWIKKYCELAKVEESNGLSDKEIPELFETLFSSIKIKMNDDVKKKYGNNLSNIGASIALKSRGRHGNVLSLSQDLLLMLCAVSVGDEKIHLKDLFNNLEQRGVKFDHYSRVEVINLLDHLNYIEKKSDSGDAQYVKPIL